LSPRNRHNPKTVVVVPIVRCIPVAIRGARVVTVVVPRPATEHPEWRHPFSPALTRDQRNLYDKLQLVIELDRNSDKLKLVVLPKAK
jgi:hypothetical protein